MRVDYWRVAALRRALWSVQRNPRYFDENAAAATHLLLAAAWLRHAEVLQETEDTLAAMHHEALWEWVRQDGARW